ncbi:MAG: NAD-dependent epimerase/dehydratase family protein [Chloroflexi bacterium]|nr:NAD-dependent epimerase/dehydratase family protein [Chloroflexota bacterium]
MADRILVLGGTGFIGRHVVAGLAAGGHTLAVFHRGHTPSELDESVHRVLGDRRSIGDHAPQLRDFRPRVVIDMIGYTEAEARTAIEALRGIAERTVVVSSQDVYRAFDRFRRLSPGPVEPIPYEEDSLLRERLFPYRGRDEGQDPWVRDYDKILVERASREEGGSGVTILRLPMVYGPGDRQHRTLPYLKRMDDGRPAILLEERQAGWRWTRGFAVDVAAAIVQVATDERAAGRTYNVGEDDALTEADWVRAIGRAVGWNGEVVAVPTGLWPASRTAEVDWTQSLVTDTSRIRRELGFQEAVGRQEGLRRTVEWERENPPLLDPGQFDYAADDRLLERLGREPA